MKRRWREIVAWSITALVFWFILPGFFRDSPWDGLQLRILVTVIGCAIMAGMIGIIVYLVLKAD